MLTDPVSVQQVRRADLIEAAQYRRRHPADPTPRDRRRFWLRRAPAPASRIDSSLELFVELDRRTMRRLETQFVLKELEAGESLARQGATRSEFVVVLDGSIGVTIDGVPITVFDRGSHFGALPLIDDGPDGFALASFDALGASRVAIADRTHFFEILERFPVVAERIRRVADIRRAYFAGHADAKALAADRELHPFPVHVPDLV